MKRLILFSAFALAALAWAQPARAQYGMNSGQGAEDPLDEMDKARSALKSQQRRAAPHAGSAYGSRSSSPGYTDRYGRIDMSGRAPSGYPQVRGDLPGARPRQPSVARRSRRYRPTGAAWQWRP